MAADVRNKKRIVDDTVLFADLILLDEDPIGAGAFGAVYAAIHQEWGCQVAYKKLGIQFIRGTSKAEKQLIQSLAYEAEIHRQLRHPNIVSMLGIVFEPGNYGIILEFVTHGSLSNFLSNLTEEDDEISCVPWILKVKLAHEICFGMEYLHRNHIIHCDLKLANILIDDNVKAKISDFGLSKWKNFSRSKTNSGLIGGTTSHMPPEKLTDINFRGDEKLDVYSFSILLWEMFTEKEAYKDNDPSMIRAWIVDGKRLHLDCLSPQVPKEIHFLIKSCWDQQASKRPTFSAIKDRLNLILCGTANEKLIKVAKGKVIETLHKLSNSEIYAEHVRKLKQRHQQLCEFVRRTDRILSRILEKREITEKEFELIYSQPTDYETVHLLINKLCDKPVSAYLVFLDALRNTGQQHVVALLEEKDYELNSDHKTALLDNYTYLKANISVSHTSLLDHLLAAEVLDVHEVEKIRSKDTNDEQVHQLLHYIMRTSYDQYQRFLEALNNAEHNFVYNTLKEVSINKIGREESELDLTTLDLNQGTADLTKVNRKQAILDTAKDDQEKRRLVATSVYLEPDNLDLANADRKQVTLDRVNDERESNGLNLSEVSRGHLNSVIAALRKVGELAISPAPILGLVPGLASFMAPKNDSRQDVIQSVPFHRELDGTDLNLRQSSEIEIDLTMFRKTASMAHFVPRNEKEYSGGITVINNQVFVARGASLVEVYKSIDFSFSHNLTITGSREIQALASCTRYNCLYLGDAGQPTIHRYDFLNKQTTNWSSSGMCRGLSITKDSSVLVTFFDTKRILEYTTRGILIREIILDSSSRVPRHCVQLSTENFVVCYPGLLGIVDRAGRVIQSYATSENLRRYSPCHVVFDQRDNILVADCSNDRVQLFSPSLTYIGDVEMPEAELKEPESLHFDELNLRLYIKESWAVTGRIFVLNIND